MPRRGTTSSPSAQSRPSRTLREVYLLSPASIGGVRAAQLRSPNARFDLATRLRKRGATIGEIYSFCSALYFRGKLTYALRFAPPTNEGLVRVITPTRGLLAPDTVLTLNDLEAFAGVDVNEAKPEYRLPLERDAAAIAERLSADGKVILLGSIATGKYRDVLLPIFGDRLQFPAAFVGRGDMSRGGLLLRHAKAGLALECTPVTGAVLRGRRVSGGFPPG